MISVYLMNIALIRVVFDRHEEELYALKQLHTAHGGDSHVEEDTKQHRQRHLQQISG